MRCRNTHYTTTRSNKSEMSEVKLMEQRVLTRTLAVMTTENVGRCPAVVFLSVLNVGCFLPSTGMVPLNSSYDADVFNASGVSNSSQLLVHFFKVYPTQYPTVVDQLSFLECLSLKSVLKNLKPNQVIIHTNVVDYWPLDSCNGLVSNWTGVSLKYLPRRFVMKGQRIKWISHEVDIAKLSVLRQYGGLTLDFDVYIINGTEVRWLLEASPCIICDENPKDPDGFKVNAGFFGCLHKEMALFPELIREKSFEADYKSEKWVYNIGFKPMEILRNNPQTATLVENVCNNPAWDNISSFTQTRNMTDWSTRPAFHTYFHKKNFRRADVMKMNSTAGDLFRWILKE